MFKLRPKTEMIWAASGLAFMSLALLLSLIGTIPPYLKFRKMAGDQIVFSADGYARLLEAYRALMFMLLPALAVLSGVGAWVVFKNLKRIRDDTPNAD